MFQESKSFGMNLFRGQIATDQVFPFPEGKFSMFIFNVISLQYQKVCCTKIKVKSHGANYYFFVVSVLNAEQEESLKMLVDPTHKFFQVMLTLIL